MLRCFVITLCLTCATFARADDAPELSPDLKRAASIAAGVAEDDLGNAALANVRTLVLNYRGTVDLTGIGRMRNLEALELRGNSISDISPLRNLPKLRYLDLTDNRVADLGPLAKLNQLRFLDVSENLVESLDALKGLKNLAALRADRNAVDDLRPLTGLKNLKDLRLAYNRVDNLTPLTKLTQIRRLDLEHNRVPSLRPIAGMKQLTRLDITNNQVAFLGPLNSVTGLRVFRAEDNPVQDIEPLTKQERLQVLRLSSTKFNGDLAPLSKLSRLRELHMPRSDITHAEPLRNLMSLRTIDLSNNQIENAEPLVRIMFHAETLDLRGNPLNAESRVTHLPRMRGKALYDGVKVAGVKALFQQFAKLDRDKSGGLSHGETAGFSPTISIEQFDALDRDRDMILTRAELYRYARPGDNSLEVAWLARKYFGGFSDGSKQAPYTKADEALAALKPNGKLMVYTDVELDKTKVTKAVKIVRVKPEKKPKPGAAVQQQTRNPAKTGDGAGKGQGKTPNKPARVVTPKLRSVYPDPPAPEPEPAEEGLRAGTFHLQVTDGAEVDGIVFEQIQAQIEGTTFEVQGEPR